MQNRARERGKRKACQHHQDAISPTWLLPYKPQKGKNATKQNKEAQKANKHILKGKRSI